MGRKGVRMPRRELVAWSYEQEPPSLILQSPIEWPAVPLEYTEELPQFIGRNAAVKHSQHIRKETHGTLHPHPLRSVIRAGGKTEPRQGLA